MILTQLSSRLLIRRQQKQAIVCLIGVKSSARFNSTLSERLKKNPIYMVSIPITNKKTFIYCKYKDSMLPSGEKGFDSKLIDRAEQAWRKIENSTNSVNVRIVKLIRSLLSKIPWYETSFRSIPSQNRITRFLLKDEEDERRKQLHPNEIKSSNLSSKHLEKIPFFYPSELITKKDITNELNENVDKGIKYHFKWLTIDAFSIPLTAPVILLPIIPNVPGFYLAYRAYCHLTAWNGAKHLKFLLSSEETSDTHNHHLEMIGLNGIGSSYLKTTNREVKDNVEKYMAGEEKDGEELLLLSEDSAKELSESMGLKEMENSLSVAIKQERQNLSRVKEDS